MNKKYQFTKNLYEKSHILNIVKKGITFYTIKTIKKFTDFLT